MNWRVLNSEGQLDLIREESKESPILIFKHSTRCSISRTVLDRLERNWNMNEMDHVKTYFLDLISYRSISNGIADLFDVEHESPQVLIIQNGKATLTKTHLAIDYASFRDALKN
ncbi:MAG TPA: bacillithiol system redox-active protein YtxJ [Ohtaekwangia sp.]